MNAPARDPEPTGVQIEAQARDSAQVYLSSRDIYVTQSGSVADDRHDRHQGMADALRVFGGPLLLLCGCAALVGVGLFGPGSLDSGPLRLISLIAGLCGLPMALDRMRHASWRRQQNRLLNNPALMRRHDRGPDRTAQRLARALRSQWEAQERLRKVQHLSPLPVRRITEERPSDHWSSVRGDGGCDTPLDLSGGFASVTETTPGCLPAGRSWSVPLVPASPYSPRGSRWTI
ncbi:hypothetical protein ACFXKG_20805 [Streptomyces sp. NPDC059255]|uniref:hypothetical protein n=1 Tax=Streptomyces sp. NPDC059255 TaxID=3346793 RepID=UPI0036BC0958